MCFHLFLRHRGAGALVALALLLAATLPAAAQRRYATTLVSFANTTNASAAVDGTTATEATLEPPLLVGLARVRVAFSSPVQPGQRAGLVLRTGGTLGLAALAGIEVRTYLGAATTPAQEFGLGSLVSLGVLNAGLAEAQFTVTQPFDQLELRAGGVANVYSIGFVQAFATASPLPVELVSFQGQATAGGVQLNWTTATEQHSREFVVERSASAGGDDFVALGRVAAAGTSPQARRYQYLDAAPLPLGYYRLRQLDDDGQAHLSSVVAVRAAPAALAAYPSPTAETVTIAAPPDARLSVYDQQGRLLRALSPMPGRLLDVSALPAGLYLVRDAASGRSTRFVKAGGGQL